MAVISEPDAGEALDLRVLAQLAAIQRNGRPGFMDQVIALFLQTAPSLIKDLELASGSDDASALHRASHTLKPCSAAVGALFLAALCEALEALARSGSVPNPIAEVTAIAEEYKRVEAALQVAVTR